MKWPAVRVFSSPDVRFWEPKLESLSSSVISPVAVEPTAPLARSYLALCTPICIMTWGNAVRERVAFWLHELPGQVLIYHHVSPPVSYGYIYGQPNGVSAGQIPKAARDTVASTCCW